MAKFYGPIGFVQHQETAPGVWEEVPVERNYYGDVQVLTNRYNKGESVNDNLNISNKISIVSDPFADHHHSDIRYVKYLGTAWKVQSIEVVSPRLILSISEVYNGPTC